MRNLKVIWLIGLLVLSLPILGQDESLTLGEVYTTDAFSVQYAEEWAVAESDAMSMQFDIPLEDDVSVIMTLELQELRMQLVRDLVDGWVETILDENPSAEQGFTVDASLHEQALAIVDIQSVDASWRYMVINVEYEMYLFVTLASESAVSINTAMPMVWESLNSFRVAGDESPIEDLLIAYDFSETHERVGEWQFEYPSGWVLQEAETFTFIEIPNIETTIGISISKRAEASDLDGWADLVMETGNFIALSEERRELDIDGYESLLLVVMLDVGEGLDNPWAYKQYFLNPNGEKNQLIMVSVVGLPHEVDAVLPVVEQMFQTLILR